MPQPPVDQLRIGDPSAILGIELNDQFGRTRRLSDYLGQPVALFFYPMDETPGCTLEGKEFRDLHEKFRALECAVVGVSTDSSSSHRAFADKHGFQFTLLSDEHGELARALGVLNGKRADRATFVIDRDGRVARSFLDVTPRGHAQRVLNFVQALVESHRMIGG
ncbi:MAG: peroxiredoxin [Deltaproteobacteria bacterium]|jgi:peroxiredoxin Q/BCP|nr:peroxiredoxin [Deltaproteobacteria bacterium]